MNRWSLYYGYHSLGFGFESFEYRRENRLFEDLELPLPERNVVSISGNKVGKIQAPIGLRAAKFSPPQKCPGIKHAVTFQRTSRRIPPEVSR